jgi:hypothetical protein
MYKKKFRIFLKKEKNFRNIFKKRKNNLEYF